MQIDIETLLRDTRLIFSHIVERIDYSKINRAIGNAWIKHIDRQFETEGRYFTGQEWAQLADSTIKARERKNKWPGKKLQVTNRLISSIGFKLSEGGISFYFASKYAARHHFGYGNTPARPLVPRDDSEIPQKFLDDIVFIYSSFFKKEFGG